MELIREYKQSYLDTLTFDELKEARYIMIDNRTGELVSQGFSYAGKVFSLSQNAQINISALDQTRNDPTLTYPITYNTIDDLDTYSVIDATDMHTMYLTALATKKGHIDGGSNLKAQVRAAIDINSINAIIDNR